MSMHLHRDMEKVHRKILALCAEVEETIDYATRALCDRKLDLAQRVIMGDDVIDNNEVQIEEDCLKILALHQPVAVDLRRIVSVIKINADLERIADLAVNIAERAEYLVTQAEFPIPKKLKQMVTMATSMVRSALDAFVHLDTAGARRVILLDEEVDRYNREIIEELYELMRDRPQLIAAAMHCFSASRHIERIADHATNIAEDVIYLVEGEIARHKHTTSI